MSPFPPAPPTQPDDRTSSRWLLGDPASFLRDVSTLTPLRPGLALALVHRPATDQHLLSVVWFDWPLEAVADSRRRERSELMRTAAASSWGSDWAPREVPEHSFVLVTCRLGRPVYGMFEAGVALAWRYVNHLLPAVTGDLLVVTPSGWASVDDQSAGAWPTL